MASVKRVVSLIPLFALLLAGCATGPTDIGEANREFMIALPRIVVEIDADGNPSIAGISPQLLALANMDPSMFALPKDLVDTLVAGDIQHIEVLHKNDGLFIFVNAKPLPHVTWTSQSMNTLGNSMELFGVLPAEQARVVKLLLPRLQNIGLDIAVKFPLKSGAKEIPLRDATVKTQLPPPSPASDVIAKTRLTLRFDRDGVPSIAGVSTRDIEALFGGAGFDFRSLELGAATVSNLQSQNVQHIVLHVTPDGVTVYVNGEGLPNIVWSEEYLKNTAELVNAFLTDPALANVREVVSTIVPNIRRVDSEIVIQFPVAQGQQQIPLPGN
ncbi:MAG: hypothetical protein RMN25_11940 [Anaerolineae bacterium]|nr:hypothetical protein [Thermoflexales bacterium]MDW8408481.1 hypothetical protein [Anaerolineae bacterium]